MLAMANGKGAIDQVTSLPWGVQLAIGLGLCALSVGLYLVDKKAKVDSCVLAMVEIGTAFAGIVITWSALFGSK